ncbi:hypothetical protein MTP99_003535 [Tenebrio molitor]|nr:hypothetical protein MTP99_003535 [Tenebrio molitor]
MAKTSDHQRNLQFKETDNETSSTSNQEQNQPPSDAAPYTTQNVICKTCGAKFAGETKRKHKRTKIHQAAAMEEFKKKKKEETERDVGKKETSTVSEVPGSAAKPNEKVETEPIEPPVMKPKAVHVPIN